MSFTQFFALSLLLLATLPPVYAFIPLTMDEVNPEAFGLVLKWNLAALPNGIIPYWINLNRPRGATPIEPTDDPEVVVAKVRNAFQAWENVPGSRVRFSYQGLTNRTNLFDGRIVVTFSPQDFEFPRHRPVWPYWQWARNAGPHSTNEEGLVIKAEFPGQYLDCDIVINPFEEGVYWVGDAPPKEDLRWDIQGYVMHELGHCLGLDHTMTAVTAVMNIMVTPAGGFTFRNLSEDEKAGISTLYPSEEFLRMRGSIGGRILRQDGTSVFGAHVIAIEAQTGVIVVGTVSGLKDVAADGTPLRWAHGSGKYLLTGLPPGQYRVYAEPFDGPNISTLCCVFDDRPAKKYQIMDKDFQPTFYKGEVKVTAGQRTSDIDIVVSPSNMRAPNLDIYGYVLEGGSWRDPILVRRGTQPVISIDPGKNILDTFGLFPGTKFSFVGPGITVTNVQPVLFPEPEIRLSLSIAPDAALGPRVLEVTTENGVAFFSGGLTVVSEPPKIRTVALDGSGRVIVNGENFAPEAIAHFDELMAREVVIESSTRIRAVVPNIQAGQRVKVAVITLGGVGSSTTTTTTETAPLTQVTAVQSPNVTTTITTPAAEATVVATATTQPPATTPLTITATHTEEKPTEVSPSPTPYLLAGLAAGIVLVAVAGLALLRKRRS